MHPESTLGWTGPGPERGAGRGDPDRHTGSGRFDRTEDRESLSFEPADGTRREGTSRDVQGGCGRRGCGAKGRQKCKRNMGNACSTRGWKTRSKIVPLQRCQEREAPACETIEGETCTAFQVARGHLVVTSNRFSAPFVSPRRPQEECEPSAAECEDPEVAEDEEITIQEGDQSSNEPSVLQDCNRSLMIEERRKVPKSARERTARDEDPSENATGRKGIARRKTCSEPQDHRKTGHSPIDLAWRYECPDYGNHTPTGIATVLEMRRLAAEKPMSVH